MRSDLSVGSASLAFPTMRESWRPPDVCTSRARADTCLALITVVDNYDSFTYNLVQQIERLAGRARCASCATTRSIPTRCSPRSRARIVISPGPGTPVPRRPLHRSHSRQRRSIPLLGVCLGHQAIAEAFGARVVRGEVPVHGKVSDVRHRGERPLRRLSRSDAHRALSLARRRARDAAGRFRASTRETRRRRDHGHLAPRAADVRHPVPSRVVRHDRRRPVDPQLPRRSSDDRRRRSSASSTASTSTATRCTTCSGR